MSLGNFLVSNDLEVGVVGLGSSGEPVLQVNLGGGAGWRLEESVLSLYHISSGAHFRVFGRLLSLLLTEEEGHGSSLNQISSRSSLLLGGLKSVLLLG